MRLGIFLGGGVTALVALVIVILTVSSVVTTQDQAISRYRMVNCDAAIGPWDGSAAASGGAGMVQRLGLDQKANAAKIIEIGKQRELSPLAWQVALQAASQESGLRNLDHGDRDSIGLFQMRPSQGWGSVEQIMNLDYEIAKFYTVLTGIPDWQKLTPGAAAQAVERSAFPDAYDKWAPMAAELIKSIGDVTDPTGCGQGVGLALPPNSAAAKAIAYAEAQLGKPYIWGGNGPVGYDCSGLVQQAYLSVGVVLPRVADQQYHAGALLPVRQAQPGDLVFLATDPSNPATIHHVAMYLGDNKIVEAQDFGIPIHIRPFSFSETEVVPQAVRPGV
ncbi:MAG: C40 family peptidase [Kutzneria sp.]|nr:C40 family peptidase [Kutzneria sp.]